MCWFWYAKQSQTFPCQHWNAAAYNQNKREDFWSVQLFHLDCNATGLWELQEMEVEVLHTVDVDSDIWCPVETLDQSSGSIVHTNPGNDLEDKRFPSSEVKLTINCLLTPDSVRLILLTVINCNSDFLHKQKQGECTQSLVDGWGRSQGPRNFFSLSLTVKYRLLFCLKKTFTQKTQNLFPHKFGVGVGSQMDLETRGLDLQRKEQSFVDHGWSR